MARELLEPVFRMELKSRYQQPNETISEFGEDIAPLVRLTYPSVLEDFVELLAIAAFVDGLRNFEIRRVLTLAQLDRLEVHKQVPGGLRSQ